MAAPPLLGFNNNVRHKGRIFHIQTEDSGLQYARILTHLFADGGRIVKSARTDYAEHLGREDMAQVVRGLMKEQHKAMFVALRAGELDDVIERACGPAPEGAAPAERASRPSLADVVLAASAPPRPSAAEAVDAGLAAAPAPRSEPPPPGAPPPRRASLSNPNLRRLSQPPPKPAEAPGRYAASRPATIFADAPKPSSASIFGDGAIREQSLDDVILSYLKEDLDEQE